MTVRHTFVQNTKIKASEVNENFADVESDIDALHTTITAEIGNSYMPKTGGTFTGALTIDTSSGQGGNDILLPSDGKYYATILTENSDKAVTTTTPASQVNFLRLNSVDKDGTQIGNLQTFWSASDGSVRTLLGAHRLVSGTTKNAQITTIVKSDGTAYATAPASDETYSIVTTVNKVDFNSSNKSYIELGNKLVLQWGYGEASSSSNTVQVTFPKAFSSAHYYAHCCLVRSGSSSAGWGYASSQSSTKCTFVKGDDAYWWFAIGYCN